jgi:predicted glycoside hydrolase/deacetylase ChbG (UPF0249 family)
MSVFLLTHHTAHHPHITPLQDTFSEEEKKSNLRLDFSTSFNQLFSEKKFPNEPMAGL